jgi:hypothetical protein
MAYKISSGCFTDKFKIPNDIDLFMTIESTYGSGVWSPDGKFFAVSGYLGEEDRGIFMFETDSQLFQDWLSSGTCGDTE